MSDRPRVTRPKPERTDPIRNWSSLFGVTPGGDGQPAAGLGDVVSRSVDLGYRVVDEYIQQGQRAAQRVAGRSSGPDTMVSDLQDAAARMANLTSDFMRVWFEMMGLAAGSVPGSAFSSMMAAAGGAAPAAPASAPAPSSAAAAPTAALRVRVEIAAQQPVDVSIDLRPEAAAAELVPSALRSADPDLPALAAPLVTRDADDGAVHLRVSVPAAHPAG
ncbi:MAG: hypothetical protein ABI629_22990, partial [bacterium]